MFAAFVQGFIFGIRYAQRRTEVTWKRASVFTSPPVICYAIALILSTKVHYALQDV